MNGFAVYETKLFFIEIGYEKDCIIYISGKEDKPKDLGTKVKITDEVFRQLTEFIDGKRKEFDFKYKLKGTDFQKKVWEALRTIPYGETRSYKDIAIQVGSPKAFRAVGMANNKNPIVIAIPCHRVIGTNGKLIGYAHGTEIKKFLLDLEQNN